MITSYTILLLYMSGIWECAWPIIRGPNDIFHYWRCFPLLYTKHEGWFPMSGAEKILKNKICQSRKQLHRGICKRGLLYNQADTTHCIHVNRLYVSKRKMNFCHLFNKQEVTTWSKVSKPEVPETGRHLFEIKTRRTCFLLFVFQTESSKISKKDIPSK